MNVVDTLTGQIGRICELDPVTLDIVRREVTAVTQQPVVEYGEYQNGGWKTLSLYNDSGDPTDTTIRDCAARETTLLEQLPATRELLRSFGLRYMWARIARLEANSFLWEHRDYGELADLERYRLHIPLRTNASAVLVLGGVRIHLAYGSMWRLMPTHSHGACNLGGPDRLHLILDCYADDAFERLTANTNLDGVRLEYQPVATEQELADQLDRAAARARAGQRDAAETALLRLFYVYAMPDGMVYDLIVEMYQRLRDDARAEFWFNKKKVMLGLD